MVLNVYKCVLLGGNLQQCPKREKFGNFVCIEFKKYFPRRILLGILPAAAKLGQFTVYGRAAASAGECRPNRENRNPLSRHSDGHDTDHEPWALDAVRLC